MIIKGQTFTRQQVDDITAPWLQLCKEQEARIKSLTAILETELKSLRWTPVSEKLPDEGVPVLVVGKPWPNDIRTALLAFDDGWQWEVMTSCFALTDADAYEWDDDYEFTHWMPLPTPPALLEASDG